MKNKVLIIFVVFFSVLGLFLLFNKKTSNTDKNFRKGCACDWCQTNSGDFDDSFLPMEKTDNQSCRLYIFLKNNYKQISKVKVFRREAHQEGLDNIFTVSFKDEKNNLTFDVKCVVAGLSESTEVKIKNGDIKKIFFWLRENYYHYNHFKKEKDFFFKKIKLSDTNMTFKKNYIEKHDGKTYPFTIINSFKIERNEKKQPVKITYKSQGMGAETNFIIEKVGDTVIIEESAWEI